MSGWGMCLAERQGCLTRRVCDWPGEVCLAEGGDGQTRRRQTPHLDTDQEVGPPVDRITDACENITFPALLRNAGR